MWKPLALVVICCAAVGSQLAQADVGNPSPAVPNNEVSAPCTPLKQIYSEKNWRERNPGRGKAVCDSAGAKRIREHFALYRRYRLVTPYRCQKGAYGTWAIPCYVIACESHFSWAAANSSGAVGPYQLLGWGAPYPARSFREKVRNHEIAHGLSISNWACA